MIEAYLGLGSNIGERISYIEKALTGIGLIDGTRILSKSGIYETEPWGVSGQRDYLNSVVKIETSLHVEELFDSLKLIEKSIGRTENAKWAEREIDIDLLFYGDLITEGGHLKVPHPEIESRKFVLVPMNEISPGFVHPVLGKSVTQLLENTIDKLKVFKYGHINIDN
jgi:2-amino-4-hydroxy-6-hydroxymethyldihydropteridine diphosphokinase